MGDIVITETGQNYDFIATVENTSDKKIDIVFVDDSLENFTLDPGWWVGILADDNGYETLEAMRAERYTIHTIDE